VPLVYPKKEPLSFLESRSTYRRWLNGSAPKWAYLLLAMRAGHMPWHGMAGKTGQWIMDEIIRSMIINTIWAIALLYLKER